MNEQGKQFCLEAKNQLDGGCFSLGKLRQDFSNPSFTDLGMEDDVMKILTCELIIDERKTYVFRELLFEKLLGIDSATQSLSYQDYKQCFSGMLDRSVFNTIYDAFIASVDYTLELRGDRRMINPDIGFHVFGNTYYLLGALQGAHLGVMNQSQKTSIKEIKWQVFRIYAGVFERAKKIFKSDYTHIHLDPYAMRPDRHAGKNRGYFNIYFDDGKRQRGIAKPSYDRFDGAPSWAMDKNGILPAKEFAPRILDQYTKNNKDALFDFLRK